MKINKPLGQKAYGSIPHIEGSRIDHSDKRISEGQSRILLERVRDKHDYIIVSEKLDGSCVAVAKLDGKILPLTRSGYLASTSPFRQHHEFEKFVYTNHAVFDYVLDEGERLVGEWLYQAHGIRYDLPSSPFVAFDLMEGPNRLTLCSL